MNNILFQRKRSIYIRTVSYKIMAGSSGPKTSINLQKLVDKYCFSRGSCGGEISSGGEVEDPFSQTDEERRRVRRDIRDIYDQLLKNRERFRAGEDSDLFYQLLWQAQALLVDVKETAEMQEDSKLFRLLTTLVREMTEDTSANEKTFRVDEFSALLGRSLNADIEPGNKLRLTRNQLISLGRKVGPRFRRAPTMKFILGAIDTEAQDMELKEGQGGKGKPREKISPVTTSKTTIVEKSQADGDGQMTDKLVRSTKQILKRVYRLVKKLRFTLHITVETLIFYNFRDNGCKPVNYFKFVIDPESFGATVENMFHVSFLVKQRSVQLSVCPDIELPVLQPVSASRAGDDGGDGDSAGKEQAIISLSYDDWEQLVEALDIKTAAIVHEEELRKGTQEK